MEQIYTTVITAIGLQSIHSLQLHKNYVAFRIQAPGESFRPFLEVRDYRPTVLELAKKVLAKNTKNVVKLKKELSSEIVQKAVFELYKGSSERYWIELKQPTQFERPQTRILLTEIHCRQTPREQWVIDWGKSNPIWYWEDTAAGRSIHGYTTLFVVLTDDRHQFVIREETTDTAGNKTRKMLILSSRKQSSVV